MIDPGPELAYFVLMDEDPEIRARALEALREAVDRGEVGGDIVTSIVAHLAESVRGWRRSYKSIKDEYEPQDQMKGGILSEWLST